MTFGVGVVVAGKVGVGEGGGNVGVVDGVSVGGRVFVGEGMGVSVGMGVGVQVAILDGVGASVGSLGNMRPEDSLGGRGLRDWTPNPIRA